MNESQWDDKLRAFLKKTGDDLKRAGNDIRVEAERLMHEVKDPDRQEKVKKGMDTFKQWARKTAEEVAGVVETGMKKAEGVVREAAEKAKGTLDPSHAPPPGGNGASEAYPAPPIPTPVDTPVAAADAQAEAPAKAAKKSIGGKKKSAGKPRASAPKKPLGKKRTS